MMFGIATPYSLAPIQVSRRVASVIQSPFRAEREGRTYWELLWYICLAADRRVKNHTNPEHYGLCLVQMQCDMGIVMVAQTRPALIFS